MSTVYQWKRCSLMTTRLVCDEPSLERSNRLLEMSGGEGL